MRTIALVLTVLAVIMVGVVAWRLMGGPLGPRSWAFIGLTVAVIIAAVATWLRPAPPPTNTTTAAV